MYSCKTGLLLSSWILYLYIHREGQSNNQLQSEVRLKEWMEHDIHLYKSKGDHPG